MHSPWGLEISIIKETGWTRDYLLWGISWQNVRMMLADAPRYKSVKKGSEEPEVKDMSFEELEKYWQT
jgi:hypothetical protein